MARIIRRTRLGASLKRVSNRVSIFRRGRIVQESGLTVRIEYERSTGEKGCTAHVFINGRKWYTGSGSTEKEALESVIQNMARLITETIERAAKRADKGG